MPSVFNRLHIRCQLDLKFLQGSVPHPPQFWHVLKIYASILTLDPPAPRISLDGILFTVRNAAFSGGEEEYYVKIETKDLR